MIILLHICNRCHKTDGQEVNLIRGKVEYVEPPEYWNYEKNIYADCTIDERLEGNVLAEEEANA